MKESESHQFGTEMGDLRLPLVSVPDSYKARLQVLLAEYNLIRGPEGSI